MKGILILLFTLGMLTGRGFGAPPVITGGISRTVDTIDQRLRITTPVLGHRVIGNALIRGNAKPGSIIRLTVSSTYYDLVADQQQRKISKGAGPLKGSKRKLDVQVNGQGFWTTGKINFSNRGWSEQYKIVATSVQGKNSTYVIVTNDTKPAVQWD